MVLSAEIRIPRYSDPVPYGIHIWYRIYRYIYVYKPCAFVVSQRGPSAWAAVVLVGVRYTLQVLRQLQRGAQRLRYASLLDPKYCAGLMPLML